MADYKNYIFTVDVETGGLPSKLKKKAVHEVALTEIAWVIIDNDTLEIVEKESWLIKPYDDNLIYDPFAAKASNITKEMCEEQGVTIEEAFEGTLQLLKKYKRGRKKPYLAGQNILKFDLDFIEGFFEWNKKDASDFFHEEIIDTMVWSRHRWPEEGKHNLAVISERCGLEHTEAHRALPDTVITGQVVIDFIKGMRGMGSKVEEKEEVRFRDTFEI
jgi:DNA polymerase III epsilon subunit-like protein